MLLDVRCAAALRTRTRGGTPLAGAPLQHLLTHCKDEGLSTTKASKRLCCYFAAICSAYSSRDRLTHCKDESFLRYETPSFRGLPVEPDFADSHFWGVRIPLAPPPSRTELA